MSKHKLPKNAKHQPRKDLKDYTIDKEVEGMVPNASGKPMPEVPRKDDKEVIDDVENMVPKVKDSDRIYITKELQDGDPKMPSHALKTLVKNQEEDAKELIDTLSKKDGGYMTQIEKLTKEQKEKLVKEIVKRKVVKFLSEQDDKEADNTEQPTEEPAEEPVADTPEPAPAPEAPAVPADTPEPAPAADSADISDTDATTDTPEPADDEDNQTGDLQDPRVAKFLDAVEQKSGVVPQVTLTMQTIKQLLNKKDARGKIQFLAFMKRLVDKSLEKMDPNDL